MKAVITTYKAAFFFALGNWRIWLMLYAAQLLFVCFIQLPFISWVLKQLEESFALDQLAESFDLNIIMDILHEQGSAVGMWLVIALLIFILFFFFQNVLVGGIVNLYKSGNKSIAEFYSAGIRHFIKNTILTILYFTVLVGILMLSFIYFSKDGLHVLDLENEVFLINRFKILIVIFVAFCFLLAIGRDLGRVHIVRNEDKAYFQNILTALSGIFSVRFIYLAFIDLVFIILLLTLYYLCVSSQALTENTIILLILIQLLVLLKIIFKMTRLGSFYLLSED